MKGANPPFRVGPTVGPLSVSYRSKCYLVLLKVPRKLLTLHSLQTCRGSGVGSIPIGRSIFSSFRPTYFPKIPLAKPVPDLKLSFPGCKSEVIHDFIFCSCQSSQLATFDRQDIPTSSPRQAALGGIAERLMFMHAAAVTPTVRPSCFVMNIV
jgi:hypothetical protein